MKTKYFEKSVEFKSKIKFGSKCNRHDVARTGILQVHGFDSKDDRKDRYAGRP